MTLKNNTITHPQHIVSFSGGKDSTAMLLHMIELNMQIDDIVFLDTGVEFPQMYEHIDRVEKYIGRKITKLKSNKSFEYCLLEHPLKGETAKKYGKGYNFPNARNRWCTGELKIDVLNDYIKDKNVIKYVGIASDEPKRIKNEQYPLVDWGWTEKKCLDYCYSKGFDWGGLYKYFNRLSCWCCYMQSVQDLRMLRKHFPELWNKLKSWEAKALNNLRPDHSLDWYEKRFRLEDKLGYSLNLRKYADKEMLNRYIEETNIF